VERPQRAPERASKPANRPPPPKPPPKPVEHLANEPSPKPQPGADAAHYALVKALQKAPACRQRGGPTGPGRAYVAFGPDGTVRAVEILTDKFRNTPTGSCISLLLWDVTIDPVQDEPPRINKEFEVPEN
jgi:hypothetical protein